MVLNSILGQAESRTYIKGKFDRGKQLKSVDVASIEYGTHQFDSKNLIPTPTCQPLSEYPLVPMLPELWTLYPRNSVMGPFGHGPTMILRRGHRR